jgi:hypothetical protein
MLAQGIQHRRRAPVQFVAEPPVPCVQERATLVAKLKAQQASLLLASDLTARFQNLQPPWGTWAGALISHFQAQTSPKLLFTCQPKAPPEILRRRRFIDRLTALRDAAETLDAQRFSEICESIDWKTRSSSELVRAIGLALKAGALMTARRMVGEGVSYHPEAADIRKYARILAPPELLRTDLPADTGPQADLAWFREHRATHRGQWVALRHGTLLAEGATLQEVLAKIGGAKAAKGLLLTRVR